MFLYSKFYHPLFGEIGMVFGYAQIKPLDAEGNLQAPTFYDVREILTNPALFTELMSDEQVSFGLVEKKGVLIPTMLNANDLDAPNVMCFVTADDADEGWAIDELRDMDDDYLQGEVVENILPYFYDVEDPDELDLTDVPPAMDAVSLRELIETTFEALDNLISKQFKYGVQDTAYLKNDLNTRQKLIAYNESSSGAFINYTQKKSQTNSTLAQTKCTDTLFVKVPKPRYSTNEDYQDMLKSTCDDIINYITTGAFDPYSMGTYTQINALNFMEILGSKDIQLIFGNEQNNSLIIQDNEEQFFNALCSYIDDFMKIYNRVNGTVVDPSSRGSVAEIPAELKRLFSAYFTLFVNLNWSHVYVVPTNELNNVITLDEESSEAQTSATDGLQYAIPPEVLETFSTYDAEGGVHQTKSIIPYCNSLISLILRNNCTMYALAEVVVKLARWGARKPTALQLNHPKSQASGAWELGLDTFDIRNTEVSVEERALDIEGYRYQLVGIAVSPEEGIPMQSEPALYQQEGLNYIDNIPSSVVAIICTQTISAEEDAVNKSDRDRTIVIDPLYAIAEIKAGTKLIYGVDYTEEDGFTVLADEAILAANTYTLNDFVKLTSNTNKSEVLYLSNSVNMCKKFTELSRNDLHYSNMAGYIRILATMNSLTSILSKATPLSQALYSMTPFVYEFFSEALVEETAGGSTISLEWTLNTLDRIFSQYDYEDIVQTTTSENVGPKRTSVFKSNDKKKAEKITLKPSYAFHVDKERIYLLVPTVNATQAGHSYELLPYNADEHILDSSQLSASIRSYNAVKNICIVLSSANKEGSKYYVTDENKELANKLILSVIPGWNVGDYAQARKTIENFLSRQSK